MLQETRRRADLLLLIVLLVVAGSTWAFVELADGIGEPETQQIDVRVLRALRTPGDLSNPLGPTWLERASEDVTALGSWSVLGIITLAVAGFLWLARKRRALLLLVPAVLGGTALSVAMKAFFDRPRPTAVGAMVDVVTRSFPSGHSMLSAVVYLTVAAMLAQAITSTRLKTYVVLLAVALSVLVGVTRVYLGVHYPTDVLAGWTAGLAWALLCWLVAGLIKRRKGPQPA